MRLALAHLSPSPSCERTLSDEEDEFNRRGIGSREELGESQSGK